MLKYAAYNTEDCDGEPDNFCVTWQMYYGFRNNILRALRPFGTVGPMGECVIDASKSGPSEPWNVENSNPEFFVVDDWYNNWSFHVIVETSSEKISNAVVISLVNALKGMPPKWAIGIAVDPDGYILLFADRIMTDGLLFNNCKDYSDVLLACNGRGLTSR